MNAYADITENMMTLYKGSSLKHMYRCSNGFHHLEICIIKNGAYDHKVYNPYCDLDDEKIYKCYEYERTSGAGIEYNYIAIYNFDE